MSEEKETMSVTDIMQAYGISKMTVHRRVKEGVLTPINAPSAILYRQHKLLFYREDVERAFQENKDERLLQTA